MNDAHVHEMQVQMWKANTWGVTGVMTKTLKTAQKPRRHVETEDHFVNALVLPPSNVASSVHIYLRNFL